MCTWLKKNHVVLSNSLFGMEFTGSYSMDSSSMRVMLVCRSAEMREM